MHYGFHVPSATLDRLRSASDLLISFVALVVGTALAVAVLA